MKSAPSLVDLVGPRIVALSLRTLTLFLSVIASKPTRSAYSTNGKLVFESC